MLKTLLTGLVFAATTTTAFAVSFAEGPDELFDTPQAPYIFDLDVGANVFSGDVGNECGDPEGPGPMKTANCVADAVDAFRTNLLSDHKITDVTFSGPAGSTIPNIPSGTAGPDAFDFIIMADTDANGLIQSDWSVEITVSKVPLPATGLLALGGLAALGAASRRRKRSAL